MDEKRCEWCGTLSPAGTEKCTLCRIPFGAPVPPPQDWSHLTGNIPVITAPLLEAPAAPAVPAEAPVVPQQVQREPLVQQPVHAHRTGSSEADQPGDPAQPVVAAPFASGLLAPAAPAAGEVVPTVGEMVVAVARPVPQTDATEIPGWRAPDDPTLRVFADRLQERERRSRGGTAARRARRRRRQLVRLMVWAVAVGLIAAVVILAPARLPSF
ncbi:hypothetical protein [Nocardioides sp.]|uniref:hypothetical protein n=1 Tax=Nocardioides sp. TaxID=35761 RepID=UPI002BBFADCB|nr:hypothetical protein [Nocardioides sp.]HSX68597.1 hypothetical protein [Nocardioides sp.]